MRLESVSKRSLTQRMPNAAARASLCQQPLDEPDASRTVPPGKPSTATEGQVMLTSKLAITRERKDPDACRTAETLGFPTARQSEASCRRGLRFLWHPLVKLFPSRMQFAPELADPCRGEAEFPSHVMGPFSFREFQGNLSVSAG